MVPRPLVQPTQGPNDRPSPAGEREGVRDVGASGGSEASEREREAVAGRLAGWSGGVAVPDPALCERNTLDPREWGERRGKKPESGVQR